MRPRPDIDGYPMDPNGTGRIAAVWQYMTVFAGSTDHARLRTQLDNLGAIGWEAVGVSNNDPTIGMNTLVVLLKRWVEPWLPPADTTPSWGPDPTGRFPLRWWDGQRWTEGVHVDGKNSVDYPFR